MIFYLYNFKKMCNNKGIIADVDYNGNVYLSPPSLTTTICKIDVANFPYDEKRCTIVFGW
jgi:hypothetical protein